MPKEKPFCEQLIYEFSNEEIIKNLSLRLKRVRFNSLLTIRELSKNTGVSESTLKRMESGKAKDLSLLNLIKIYRFIGRLQDIEQVVREPGMSPYMYNPDGTLKHKYPKKEYLK